MHKEWPREEQGKWREGCPTCQGSRCLAAVCNQRSSCSHAMSLFFTLASLSVMNKSRLQLAVPVPEVQANVHRLLSYNDEQKSVYASKRHNKQCLALCQQLCFGYDSLKGQL